MRPSKQQYYMKIASEVARRSTCLRRQYGAVIVKDDVIVSTGYNGACRGEDNCSDLGYCERERLGVPHGERYELCKAVHAEANSIISGNRSDMIGADLYVFGWEAGEPIDTECCLMCSRMIKNARIRRVFKNHPGQSIEAADISG
jgi:dCMP deaminase